MDLRIFDYKPPRSLADCDFVGLQWFKMLFTNKTQVTQLLQVMKNTFAMSFLGILTSILPLGFAILLNEIKCKKFKTFVQTFTTLPNFISWVLVYSVAFALFSSTGMVNSLLENLGVITEPLKFLDSDSHTYLWMLLWTHGKDSDGELLSIWHPLRESIRSFTRQPVLMEPTVFS